MEIIKRGRRFLRGGRPEKRKKNETHEQRATRISRNRSEGQKARWRRAKADERKGEPIQNEHNKKV